MVIGGMATLLNAIIMYGFFTIPDMPWHFRLIQQILSCTIVPAVYTYFAIQMGRSWFNEITMVLWSLMLLLLVPTGIFTLDHAIPELDASMTEYMTQHFFVGGKQIFWLRNADIVILLQGLVTLTRLFWLIRTMHRYRLALSPRMHYFELWWICAIIFIIFTSRYRTYELAQHPLIDIYYISFSALITTIFVLITLDLDLHPIMMAVEEYEENNSPSTTPEYGSSDNVDEHPTIQKAEPNNDEGDKAPTIPTANSTKTDNDEGKVVENMDVFFMQSRVIAERVRVMMEEKNRYLDTSFTTERAILELGTNRTYFYRMIKAEFGCTFTELLVQYRIRHAAKLLTSTTLPVQDIAVTCGFMDRGTFLRRFRQKYGETPSRYRETHV